MLPAADVTVRGSALVGREEVSSPGEGLPDAAGRVGTEDPTAGKRQQCAPRERGRRRRGASTEGQKGERERERGGRRRAGNVRRPGRGRW